MQWILRFVISASLTTPANGISPTKAPNTCLQIWKTKAEQIPVPASYSQKVQDKAPPEVLNKMVGCQLQRCAETTQCGALTELERFECYEGATLIHCQPEKVTTQDDLEFCQITSMAALSEGKALKQDPKIIEAFDFLNNCTRSHGAIPEKDPLEQEKRDLQADRTALDADRAKHRQDVESDAQRIARREFAVETGEQELNERQRLEEKDKVQRRREFWSATLLGIGAGVTGTAGMYISQSALGMLREQCASGCPTGADMDAIDRRGKAGDALLGIGLVQFSGAIVALIIRGVRHKRSQNKAPSKRAARPRVAM